MVYPSSTSISRVPAYFFVCLVPISIPYTGISPSASVLSSTFYFSSIYISHQATPRSLAATQGISFDFFSFGYLDVSVPQVRFIILCIHIMMTTSLWPGSPIRTSLAITVVSTSLKLFAEYHVLLRLLLPRHPPFALLFLTI